MVGFIFRMYKDWIYTAFFAYH